MSKKQIKEGFVGQRMLTIPPTLKKSFLKNTLIRNLYLTHIGYYPKAYHHYRERKSGSSQYILIYCMEGSGSIYLHSTEYRLSPNMYFIIPRNVPHRYASSEDDPWSIYWVHFNGELADSLYLRELENGRVKAKPIGYNEARIELFDQIYTTLEYSYDEREMEMMNLNLQHLISSFIYNKDTKPPADNNVANSIAYMKTQLSKAVTIQSLAKQQDVSVSHYSSLFKAKTGSSPIQYFNQLKVQKSCQYLYFTDRSVKEISNELGFEDPYYFSRLFKKLIGVSPINYRLMHRR